MHMHAVMFTTLDLLRRRHWVPDDGNDNIYSYASVEARGDCRNKTVPPSLAWTVNDSDRDRTKNGMPYKNGWGWGLWDPSPRDNWITNHAQVEDTRRFSSNGCIPSWSSQPMNVPQNITGDLDGTSSPLGMKFAVGTKSASESCWSPSCDDSIDVPSTGSPEQTSEYMFENTNQYARNNEAGPLLPGTKFRTDVRAIPIQAWKTYESEDIENFIRYSRKVFLGGIPWNVTVTRIAEVFNIKGTVQLEWPGAHRNEINKHLGYAYLILQNEHQVQNLLHFQAARLEAIRTNNCHQTSLQSRIPKLVEVIPWDMNNNYFIKEQWKFHVNEVQYKVFVGGLHGKFSARGLAEAMDGLFNGVVYAALETDQYSYPIGVGQVGFVNKESYIRAINSNHVTLQGGEIERTIQIEPYVTTNEYCSMCLDVSGQYFCKDLGCLRYFCLDCFTTFHLRRKMRLTSHVPKFRDKNLKQKQFGDVILSYLKHMSRRKFQGPQSRLNIPPGFHYNYNHRYRYRY